MGFGFSLGKKTNTVKFIRKYVIKRVKERQNLNDQLDRLNAQLQNNTIDQHTYERLRVIVEINLFNQRNEALEKAFLNHKQKD